MRSPSVQQAGNEFIVRLPAISTSYVRALMRADCFPALLPLFNLAHDPVKEISESYAAFDKLRPWQGELSTVVHVGDGAHCRTAALFAFMTKHSNVSVDPAIQMEKVSTWMLDHSVRGLLLAKSKIEEFPIEELAGPLLLTFVHAHVDTDEVLARVEGKWHAAYVSACCEPHRQLSRGKVIDEGEDWAILSPQRRFQVVVP